MCYSNDKIVKVESNRRAKKLIILIGEKQAVKFAIEIIIPEKDIPC